VDLKSQYCPARGNLEGRLWALATRLSTSTGKLLNLVGKDHVLFLSMKDDCRETQAEIVELRQKLADHRLHHGC
jgi:hypothetical protein